MPLPLIPGGVQFRPIITDLGDVLYIDLGDVPAPLITEVRAEPYPHVFLDGTQVVDQSPVIATQYEWQLDLVNNWQDPDLQRDLLLLDQSRPTAIGWTEVDGLRYSISNCTATIEPGGDNTASQTVRIVAIVADPALPKPSIGVVDPDDYAAAVRPVRLYVERYQIGPPQVQTLTFSADLITGNIFNALLDGTAQAPVEFQTDHATTFTAIAARIQSFYNVRSAVGDPISRVITITSARPGTALVITSPIVTGGASQPVITLAETVANPVGYWAEVEGVVSASVSQGIQPLDRIVASSSSLSFSSIDGFTTTLGGTYRIYAGIGSTVEVLYTGLIGEDSRQDLQKSSNVTARDFLEILREFSVGDVGALVNVSPTEIARALLRGIVKQFPDAYPNTGDVWITSDPEPAQWWAKLNPVEPLNASTGIRTAYTLDGFAIKEAEPVNALEVIQQIALADTHRIRTDEYGRLLITRPVTTGSVLSLDEGSVVDVQVRKGDSEIINDVTVTSAPYARSTELVAIGEVYTLQETIYLDGSEGDLDGDPNVYKIERTLNWAANRDLRNTVQESSVGAGISGSLTSHDRRAGDETFPNPISPEYVDITTVGSGYCIEDGAENTVCYTLLSRNADDISVRFSTEYAYGQVDLNISLFAVGLPIVQPTAYSTRMVSLESQRAFGARAREFEINFLPPTNTLNYTEGACKSILTQYARPSLYATFTIPGRADLVPEDFRTCTFANLFPVGQYRITAIQHTIMPGWVSQVTVKILNIENLSLTEFQTDSSVTESGETGESTTSTPATPSSEINDTPPGAVILAPASANRNKITPSSPTIDALSLQAYGGSAATLQNCEWTSLSANVTASGYTLTRSGGVAGFTEGARSTQTVAAGNCYVDFECSRIDRDVACGLTNGDAADTLADIDFAVVLAPAGLLTIYESGVLKYTHGSVYAKGDRFRVAVDAGAVKYSLIRGLTTTLLYTSATAPTYPLVADASISSTDGQILYCQLSGFSGGSSYSGSLLKFLDSAGATYWAVDSVGRPQPSTPVDSGSVGLRWGDWFFNGLNMTAFTLPTGAALNKILTSDAGGIGTWQDPATKTTFAGYGSGTAYALTATPAAVVMGTTSPTITLTTAGTYLITGRVRLDYNGATFAANRTVTLALRRTNNTPADLTNGGAGAITGIVTTVTGTFVDISWQAIYTTALTTDILTINASVSVVPSAGSLDVAEAAITAIRLG